MAVKVTVKSAVGSTTASKNINIPNASATDTNIVDFSKAYVSLTTGTISGATKSVTTDLNIGS